MDELADKAGYTSASKRSIIYQIESEKAEIAFSRVPTYASALETNVYYLLGMSDIDDLTDEEILQLVKEYYERRKSSGNKTE